MTARMLIKRHPFLCRDKKEERHQVDPQLNYKILKCFKALYIPSFLEVSVI